MKTNFRPIPITILDFLGVLLPGWVWLFLICATYDYISTFQATLKGAWTRINAMQVQGSQGLGPLTIIFLALIIGYAVKPVTMRLAQQASKYLFKLSRKAKQFTAREMHFPYDAYFSTKPYYDKTSAILQRVCDLHATADLPGKSLFSSAKRYLRLLSPMLWEESERMEAEVRILGNLLLASIYSNLLSAVVVITAVIRMHRPPPFEQWAWLITTIAVSIELCIGFNRARMHEVEYTYMNMLLAEGYRVEQRKDLDIASHTCT
jgi:TM2 domain-containing membrane protein YozV